MPTHFIICKHTQARIILPMFFLIGLSLLSSALKAEVINIDNKKLKSLLDAGTALIDLRRDDEWQDLGIVENSHTVTFFDQAGKYDTESWLRQVKPIADTNTPLILICHTGVRTKLVADWLSDQVGYRTVYNVTDGIKLWIKQGHATVSPTN